jgi:hypothetical protein
MSLPLTKAKPLMQKAVQFPAAIELGHTAPNQGVRKVSAASTMAKDFNCPNILINPDSHVRFGNASSVVDKAVGQRQRRRVLDSL